MFAQHGEDDIVNSYFGENYIGTCIDIGAANGVTGNNTFLFEQKQWCCLCIEPNPKHFSECKRNRKHVLNYAVGDFDSEEEEFIIYTLNDGNEEAISSLKTDEQLVLQHKHLISDIKKINVRVKTLNSILKDVNLFKKIDFVSIDTEGTEIDVLKGFDINTWRPKLFVIENNHNQGHLECYLKQFGYRKDKRHAVNDFYVLD